MGQQVFETYVRNGVEGLFHVHQSVFIIRILIQVLVLLFNNFVAIFQLVGLFLRSDVDGLRTRIFIFLFDVLDCDEFIHLTSVCPLVLSVSYLENSILTCRDIRHSRIYADLLKVCLDNLVGICRLVIYESIVDFFVNVKSILFLLALFNSLFGTLFVRHHG